jgi:hypothetical protein
MSNYIDIGVLEMTAQGFVAKLASCGELPGLRDNAAAAAAATEVIDTLHQLVRRTDDLQALVKEHNQFTSVNAKTLAIGVTSQVVRMKGVRLVEQTRQFVARVNEIFQAPPAAAAPTQCKPGLSRSQVQEFLWDSLDQVAGDLARDESPRIDVISLFGSSVGQQMLNLVDLDAIKERLSSTFDFASMLEDVQSADENKPAAVILLQAINKQLIARSFDKCTAGYMAACERANAKLAARFIPGFVQDLVFEAESVANLATYLLRHTASVRMQELVTEDEQVKNILDGIQQKSRSLADDAVQYGYGLLDNRNADLSGLANRWGELLLTALEQAKYGISVLDLAFIMMMECYARFGPKPSADSNADSNADINADLMVMLLNLGADGQPVDALDSSSNTVPDETDDAAASERDTVDDTTTESPDSQDGGNNCTGDCDDDCGRTKDGPTAGGCSTEMPELNDLDRWTGEGGFHPESDQRPTA